MRRSLAIELRKDMLEGSEPVHQQWLQETAANPKHLEISEKQ